MNEQKSRKPEKVQEILSRSLPWQVARRLPPSALLRAWEQAVGPYIQARSRPVCLDENGRLVVEVKGAALRQELTLLMPEIMAKLEEAGQALPGLRLTPAKSQPLAPAPPAPPELDEAECRQALEQVKDVQDSAVRQQLLSLYQAGLTALKAEKQKP